MKIVIHEDDTGWAPKEERYHAYDADTYDCDCDQDGFFSTSPVGHGPTPEAARDDLLELMLDHYNKRLSHDLR